MQDDCDDAGETPVRRTAAGGANEYFAPYARLDASGAPERQDGPGRQATPNGSDGPAGPAAPGVPDGDIAPTGLRASSGYLLARLGAESRRRWARMLSERGLTPHHYGVLMTLNDLSVTYQQRLSHAIGVDPRNAVPVVDHLQRRGLIERTRDPADRRRHAIALTDEGRTAVAELRRAAEVIEREMLRGLTADERTVLHRLLHKLFETAL